MYGVLRAIAVTAWAGVVVVGVFAAGVLGGSQTGSASAGAAAREQLLVRQLEFPLPLAVRGERVEVGYDAQRGPNLVETPKATGTWTATGPMVDPYLQYAGAALLPNGNVLYAGGSKTTFICPRDYCPQIAYAAAELYAP